MNTNASWQQKSDQELVAATLKNRQIFGVLVERYTLPLARYIRRLGANQELAEDILQESFIKVYIHLNDFDSSLSFSAWMYRIVHNETINQFRKVSARPMPVERKEDLTLFDKIPDELDILAQADTGIFQRAVQAALGSIDGRYRDVIVLRFFEEKSYDEISDILQIPAGTVATYLNRGKAKLKELLKKNKAIEV